MWLIYVLLGFVLLVNVVGLRVVAQVQIVFFVGLVVSLLTFIVPGAAAIETANYTRSSRITAGSGSRSWRCSTRSSDSGY